MYWWLEFKRQYELGSILDLEVDRKVPPGFLFFKFSDDVQGTLHVSELNWNFGLSQTDFRNIQVGSLLRVYIIGFDDKYKKVHLSRKRLPDIEKPSESVAWENLILHNDISATVFEEFRNKAVIQLENGLFATIPLLEGKSFQYGAQLSVIPLRKLVDQNIIECTLTEIAAATVEQSSGVIQNFKEQTSQNAFSSSEFCLNSYHQLSSSLYWNYFSDEEKATFKTLFEDTPNLFSKVEKGEEEIYIDFDFDYNGYNDFLRNVSPTIFNIEKLPLNFTEKDLLVELSKYSFWYTQFEIFRKIEGTAQNITEKVFSLFNETLSIRGIMSDEGSLKIRNIKAKTKTESLKEKQTALKRNDVFFLDRPIIFSQFAPINTFNKQFVYTIDNKLIAYKLFDLAKTKSLDILEKEGKEFKIFSNFLESQIDFEIKTANETEAQLNECKLILDVQTDGITFTAKSIAEIDIKVDDKVAISNRNGKEVPHSIGSGTIISIKNGWIEVKTNIENFELIKNGCFIKRISSLKQYNVQIEVLKEFFSNKLPLDTFYKVFHDKDGLLPPEIIDVIFENEIFKGKDNPQTQAVKKAVGNKNIFLIQGPPGTGKTTVITEIVKQLINRGERVLVTSQTHIAVDNVLERIKNDTRINIARVGHQDTISEFATEYLVEEARKTYSEKGQRIIDIKIELINHHNQGRDISEVFEKSFNLPIKYDWQNIQSFISLVKNSDLSQTLLMIETLGKWKDVIVRTPELLTKLFLQSLDVLFGTCIGLATNRELSASDLIFETVILDEAGKANISETLTAISKAKKIILVGDHKQLPPYLDRERVEYFKQFSKEIADQKTSDYEIKQALGSSFFEYLQRDGVLKAENKILLSEQHRMHPDIGNFISQSFYNSELQNGEHTKENIIPLPAPFDKQLIFIDTSSDNGSYESFKDGSYFNEVEAEFIVSKIIPELERNNINPKSYAIISPYNKQCEKIRELLKTYNEHASNLFEVATLDSFQGREHDIIIFSFTRCSLDKTVGFLDDARRLNVAFSRARKKLILIGNAETLTSRRSHFEPYYVNLFTNLWKYARKYGQTYKINELDFRKLQTSFKIGEIKTGIIRRIQEKVGVFVDLGTKDGLIPISFFAKHPSEFLEAKQEIEVEIKNVDPNGRITLLLNGEEQRRNLKQIRVSPKPGDNNFDLFTNEFKVSDEAEVKIIKIAEHTCNSIKVFVEFKHGVLGMLYTSFENHKIATGKGINVRITKIDSGKKFVRCKLIL